MSDHEADIRESIFNQVRMGFLSLDDIQENILEEIQDNECDDELSEDWAIQAIEAEQAAVLAESKTWQSPSDVDRLMAAFDELCAQNIIALHCAGYTTDDGEYEVAEVERALREQGVVSDGYCFYHEQDLARALDRHHPVLLIAFQKIDNQDEAVTVAVGEWVTQVLKKHGLTVDWNGSAQRKIELPGFRWQRLDNADLLDYDAVVQKMTCA